MLSEYASVYRNRKVGFIGLGVSNLPVVKLFASCGAICSVRDKKDLSGSDWYGELAERGIGFHFGEEYLSDIDEELLFLSPAVRPDISELASAASKGTRLTSETEEFFRLCPCKKIAVTGSDGKTTTTTMISLLLKKAGYNVHLGGNIGTNLLASLDDIGKDDFAVAELSSFQLMKMDISPDIAVVTNIAPNHLDWHTGMDEYIAAKKNIFAFQSKNGILVLNADDGISSAFGSEAKGEVRKISGKTKGDVYFDESGIFRKGKLLAAEKDIKLVGRHNRYNYCEAYAAVRDYVPEECLALVASEFGGVEHRIEFVREVGGVKYYNSSIDSSPSRTKACLESFSEKVIVICGGYDKHIPYDPLGPLFRKKVKYAILIGATAKAISKVLDSSGFRNFEFQDDMKTAVAAAKKIALPGDIVVLSPASASFDMFRNFAERGNVFKELINRI